MRRAFVPAAILLILLALCLWGKAIALTLDPVLNVNTTRRPRIGATR